MASRNAPLLATLLALSAVALLPASAGGVFLSGTLAPVAGGSACARDPGRLDPAALACAQRVAGLRGATALALSPDGHYVYVAAADSATVVVLARRPGGGLTPPVRPSRRDCVQQSGGVDCASGAPGLAGADAVLVSPDGRNVYVGSADAGAVVGFARHAHGLLSLLPQGRARGRGHPLPHPRRRLARGRPHPRARHARKGDKKQKPRGAPGPANCVHGQETVGGAAGRCEATFAPLQRVSALAISHDGHFLYALSSGEQPGEDTLVALRRGRDGTLTPMPGCVSSHGGGGRPLCPRRATGLRGASALVLSPDGRFAYVASAVSSAVAGFQLDRASGAVMPLQGAGACVAQTSLSPAVDVPGCPVTASGLGGARTLALSLDGRLVYVGGFDPGSLAVLGRDPVGGGLVPPTAAAPAVCLQAGPGAGCTAGLDALRGTSAIALSRAGDRVFLAAQGDDAALEIGLAGGLPALPLSPFSHFGPLGGPQAIARSRDGRNVYLASPTDDEVMALYA